MHVPGSLFPGYSHPFAWYAIVQERQTGRRWTYWMNGSQLTRESVAEHIAVNYPNVKAITIDRCTKSPDKTLVPVPPHHFQFGLLAETEKDDPALYRKPEFARTIVSLSPSLVPISRKAQPLWPLRH